MMDLQDIKKEIRKENEKMRNTCKQEYLYQAVVASLALNHHYIYEDAEALAAFRKLRSTLESAPLLCEQAGPIIIASAMIEKEPKSDFTDRLIDAMEDDDFRRMWIDDVTGILALAEKIPRGKIADYSTEDHYEEALFYLALDDEGKHKWLHAMLAPLLV